MVYLHLFRCPKAAQHTFWRTQLPVLLQKHFGITNSAVIQRPDGKPALKDGAAFFNVSHSGDRLAIALSDREIGVDMEQYGRPISDRLRRYCLTAEELARTPPEDARSFIKIWTAKESYIKLYGTGLRQPMREFSVLGDVFSAPRLPSAVFHRVELENATLCIAAEQKETLQTVALR